MPLWIRKVAEHHLPGCTGGEAVGAVLTVPLNTVAVQETLLRDQSVAWLGQVGRLLVLYCTLQFWSNVTHFPPLNINVIRGEHADFYSFRTYSIECEVVDHPPLIKGTVQRDF